MSRRPRPFGKAFHGQCPCGESQGPGEFPGVMTDHPSPLPTRQKWGFLPLLNSPEDFPRLLKRRYQSGDPQCWGLLNVLIGWGSWPRQRLRNPGRVCPVLVPGLQPRQWSQPGWRWVVGTGLRQVLKLPGWCNIQWGLRTSFRLSVWSPQRPLHPTSTVTRENGGGWRFGDWHPFSSLSFRSPPLLFCLVLPPSCISSPIDMRSQQMVRHPLT